MTLSRSCLFSLVALLLSGSAVWAATPVQARRVADATPPAGSRPLSGAPVKMEKVTTLGVETAPVNRTLGTQLGLAKDVGLVVTAIMPGTPAADALQEDDILMKLDDQLLINAAQFGVLVRSKKDGDEIRLTLVRGGKEQTIKVRLAEREQPRRDFRLSERSVPLEKVRSMQELLRQLPGSSPEEAREVFRMFERERGEMTAGPQVRIYGREGRGSTILDLPKSTITFADSEGSLEIKTDEGKRTLTVKDGKGAVTFEGPIGTSEERAALPAEVARRLEKLERNKMNFEPRRDFQPNVVPLPQEPAKTKISQPAAPATRLREEVTL